MDNHPTLAWIKDAPKNVSPETSSSVVESTWNMSTRHWFLLKAIWPDLRQHESMLIVIDSTQIRTTAKHLVCILASAAHTILLFEFIYLINRQHTKQWQTIAAMAKTWMPLQKFWALRQSPRCMRTINKHIRRHSAVSIRFQFLQSVDEEIRIRKSRQFMRCTAHMRSSGQF